MKPMPWHKFLNTLRQIFEPVMSSGGVPLQSLDREQIINRVRKEMKKEDRFVTAKQVCAILSTAQVMPSSCFCTSTTPKQNPPLTQKGR